MKTLEEYKKELLAILDKQEKKELSKNRVDNFQKSLVDFLGGILIEKGRLANIGEVREWKGKKYVKVAQGKWKRKYDNTKSRGALQSIRYTKKKIANATSIEELSAIVRENRLRFMDENKNPLPIVKELFADAQRNKVFSTSTKGRQKKVSEKIRSHFNKPETKEEVKNNKNIGAYAKQVGFNDAEIEDLKKTFDEVKGNIENGKWTPKNDDDLFLYFKESFLGGRMNFGGKWRHETSNERGERVQKFIELRKKAMNEEGISFENFPKKLAYDLGYGDLLGSLPADKQPKVEPVKEEPKKPETTKTNTKDLKKKMDAALKNGDLSFVHDGKVYTRSNAKSKMWQAKTAPEGTTEPSVPTPEKQDTKKKAFKKEKKSEKKVKKEKLPLKFSIDGIKTKDGEYIRVRMGLTSDGSVYAEIPYGKYGHLPKELEHGDDKIQNDSDPYTDYFDSDSIILSKENPYYVETVKGAFKQEFKKDIAAYNNAKKANEAMQKDLQTNGKLSEKKEKEVPELSENAKKKLEWASDSAIQHFMGLSKNHYYSDLPARFHKGYGSWTDEEKRDAIKIETKRRAKWNDIEGDFSNAQLEKFLDEKLGVVNKEKAKSEDDKISEISSKFLDATKKIQADIHKFAKNGNFDVEAVKKLFSGEDVTGDELQSKTPAPKKEKVDPYKNLPKDEPKKEEWVSPLPNYEKNIQLFDDDELRELAEKEKRPLWSKVIDHVMKERGLKKSFFNQMNDFIQILQRA